MKFAAYNEFEKANIFGKGDFNESYSQYFTGKSFLNPLTNPKETSVFLANVTFEPGCRNNWHIHHASSGGGQILICTAGEGWYQEENKPPVSLAAGDVITIPPEVKHWHGAKKDSWFSHIAVEVPGENASNEWCEVVSDEEYKRLKEEETAMKKVTAGHDALGTFAPKFAEMNDDVLFGQIWSREDKLPPRDRSLITVTALMASGVLDSSLKFHIQRAKENGVTKEEMAETLTHLAFYAGWPKAWAAFYMAKEVYGE